MTMISILDRLKKHGKNYKVLLPLLLMVVFVPYYTFWLLPDSLFSVGYSTVLESRDQQLMGALIADDGQWRFPAPDSVPYRFRQSIIHFEDKNFYHHPGIDFLAFGRAFWQNLRSWQIVSGGSTITMQVVRLSRNESRTIWEKALEILWATRLEFKYNKDEILNLYAAHAPFGGNVVGLEAASWRYYGRPPHLLSWAESATLAVLPNSPSMIYPGKNELSLRNKRNRLLLKLFQKGIIDQLSYELACTEPLPQKPYALPRLAPHLLDRLVQDGHKGKRVVSTLDYYLQGQVNRVLKGHHAHLSANEVYNAAALILDVNTGNALAYVGNVVDQPGPHGQQVDVIMASRSTGSILKPFLFAAALDAGQILPSALQSDIPTFMKGFVPQNFSKTFDGMLPANEALIRSLNVPFVLMLQEYGIERFHGLLQKSGISTLSQPPNHYGLSLILGGAEANLWDITGMYASASRSLNNYFRLSEPQRYNLLDYHSPCYIASPDTVQELSIHQLYSAGAVYKTFETLTELYRPNEDAQWHQFSSAGRIAWKTGTSFGFRDGWAVGTTPQYTIGVWVGNADGEGRPGLTGVQTAAPVLFDLFSVLNTQAPWFEFPNSDLSTIEICPLSGFKAGSNCEKKEIRIPKAGSRTDVCPYHQLIYLDQTEKFRVSSQCYSVQNMKPRTWFSLPPVQEWYYKKSHSRYKTLPAWHPGCEPLNAQLIDIIFPKDKARVYIPIELDGKTGQVVFEAVHRQANSTLYWHLDETFIGTTQNIHQMALSTSSGKHKLTLLDHNGNMLEQSFTVLSD